MRTRPAATTLAFSTTHVRVGGSARLGLGLLQGTDDAANEGVDQLYVDAALARAYGIRKGIMLAFGR